VDCVKSLVLSRYGSLSQGTIARSDRVQFEGEIVRVPPFRVSLDERVAAHDNKGARQLHRCHRVLRVNSEGVKQQQLAVPGPPLNVPIEKRRQHVRVDREPVFGVPSYSFHTTAYHPHNLATASVRSHMCRCKSLHALSRLEVDGWKNTRAIFTW
jgi:hypothetical protein